MTPEKWKETVGKIKDNFEIEDSGREFFEDQGGIETEHIIFNGPLGRMRLEFVSKPVVLDRKTKYSNRIGAQTIVDYVYSDSEKSRQFKAYKWDSAFNDWVEIDSKKINL